MENQPTGERLDIDYVANLARLDLTEEERDRFSRQLADILEYFERLSSVDVTGIEPSAHPFEVSNVWEEDEPVAGLTVEEALLNAPEVRDSQIVMPKVVEDA